MAFWKSESPVYGAFHLVHLKLVSGRAHFPVIRASKSIATCCKQKHRVFTDAHALVSVH